MGDLLSRYHELFRWLAEYSLLPAHLLAVAHATDLAVCVGCLSLIAHGFAAFSHMGRGETEKGTVEA